MFLVLVRLRAAPKEGGCTFCVLVFGEGTMIYRSQWSQMSSESSDVKAVRDRFLCRSMEFVPYV